MASDPRRRIPRTDDLLADPLLAGIAERSGSDLVKAAIGAAQAECRSGTLVPEAVRDRAAALAATAPYAPCTQHPALNATGVVVHTNLGRAPLSAAALAALQDAGGYVDVEYDAVGGGRACPRPGRPGRAAGRVPGGRGRAGRQQRGGGVVAGGDGLRRTAAAVLVSRGEMVEIGDGFRLPDLIESTGVRIVEVGTTNRTRLADYAAAASAAGATGPAAAILKVHPSNFRVEGFTAQAGLGELAGLARDLGVPLIVDIGSGLLAPDPALPDEPDATTALRAGADLVTAPATSCSAAPRPG